MKQKPSSRRRRNSTKSVLRLPDLEHAKAAVLGQKNTRPIVQLVGHYSSSLSRKLRLALKTSMDCSDVVLQAQWRVGSLLKFFTLTFTVTWTCFISAVAISHRSASTDMRLAIRGLVLVGTFAPALVALVLAERANTISGPKALLTRLFQWRVGARWYLFAVSFMAAIKLTVTLAHRVITGSWPRFGDEPLGIIVAAIIISTPVQSGEELGWRGYALPRLAERFGFARASIALGLIWASWHLPLFFLAIPGNDEYGQSFPVWALGVTALSVAFAWLYTHSKGSLLLTMLMHSAVNNIPHLVPSGVANPNDAFSLHASLAAWLTVAFLWTTAAYFLVRMPKEELSADDEAIENNPHGR
jgi:membrane protease YdiL (CAAX protease family)